MNRAGIKLFETVNQVCTKHGDTVFAKLTTDRRAPHICVRCALDLLKARAENDLTYTNTSVTLDRTTR